MPTPPRKRISLPDETCRLLYLTDALRIPIPAQIAKQIFMGDLLLVISTKGYRAAIKDLGIPEVQLEEALAAGSEVGLPDESEFRMLVASQALEGLEGAREQQGVSAYLAALSQVSDFAKATKSDMISFRRESMSTLTPDEDFPKWDSGFTPLDLLTGGLYQGLHLLLAKSGTGKTSAMLTLTECLARQGFQNLWYISTEIPMNMMKWRMKPIISRGILPQGFEVITGQLTPKQVLAMHEAEYVEGRIIIHDSPDALGGSGDNRRFTLEDHFRDMVALKERSLAIFTVSQVRRKDRVIGMESVAEAWSKAWYSDTIWTIGRTGYDKHGHAIIRSSLVKNRFGMADQQLKFTYDYSSLTYDASDSHVTMLGDEWEDTGVSGDPTLEAIRGSDSTQDVEVTKPRKRPTRERLAHPVDASGGSW